MKFLNYILATFSIFTGSKSFADNPILGSKYLNKNGLHRLRMRLADWKSNLYRKTLKSKIPSKYIDDYERNGYIEIKNYLSQAVFNNICDEILNHKWHRLDMNQGGVVTRRVLLDSNYLEKKEFLYLKTVIESPNLKNLIRYVAGTGGEPIFSLQAVFAGFFRKNNDPQASYHSDTFHSTAKAWLFLEDVNEKDGPFSYINGSHKLSKQRLDWEQKMSCEASNHPIRYHARGSFRANDSDLLQLNLNQKTTFSVKANTLVIANTMGFHRRTPSHKQNLRVEIYASLRKNPFSLFPGIDILSIPPINSRIGSCYWFAVKKSSQWLGTKQPWKESGFGFIKEHIKRMKQPASIVRGR